ncbi:MAG: DUF3047 domain-containing protein [Candidatus Manganitrophaceae bacterium]
MIRHQSTNCINRSGRRSSRVRIFFPLLFLLFLLPVGLRGATDFQEYFSLGLNKSGLPVGWSLRQWFGNRHLIELVEEGENRLLRMFSDKNSFGVYREFKLDPKITPILHWKWKVTRLPEGGDVRSKNKDDQAAQIYVMFPRFPKMINTRLVGYLWETSAPKLAQVVSQKSSNTRYIVLQSGKERLGEWVPETRNVYEDYKALFGEEPPQIGGITLMIDSDDTGSSAESYFSDIRIDHQCPTLPSSPVSC